MTGNHANVQGGTVQSLLREYARGHISGLPFGIVARITMAVCEALHAAHFEPDGAPRAIVHRDISPSNVMVGYDGQVTLVGIAQEHEGTYGYMSPEQINRQPLDHRTDIFSLGTMMWELLVGKRLFKRDTDMQTLYATLEEPIPKPSDRNDAIPPAMDQIVMRALARQREDRYQDALEIAQDLAVIAKGHAWDTEPATLAKLVRELIPEQPAGGPTATEADVDDTAASKASTGSGMVIAILILVLISSVAFWVAIAPNL
jgi:serine/threonine protein kinase